MESIIRDLDSGTDSIVIIGLGYVGLPLAVTLAQSFKVIGFDIDKGRVQQLKDKIDRTNEVDNHRLDHPNLEYTTDPKQIKDQPVYIVTVPTPVDNFHNPDLTSIISASRSVGAALNPTRKSMVIYESTVYPGVTEGVCIQTIEKASGLKNLTHFEVAYSPERVNPGDRQHSIDKILKIISAQTPAGLKLLEKIYSKVTTAGLHHASSIKVAEAAKVIENTQRDVNIAIINEFAMLFDMIGIDSTEVLAAAGTKWNFLNFRPGLVGGHCIGVDPYYLAHLAESYNVPTDVIDASRRTNDMVPIFIARKALKMAIETQRQLKDGGPLKIAILGLSFKENVPDMRNSKIHDLNSYLKSFGVETYLVDPVVVPEEALEIFDQKLHTFDELPTCHTIIVGVGHKEFLEKVTPKQLADKIHGNTKTVLDVKGIYSKDDLKKAGLDVWRL